MSHLIAGCVGIAGMAGFDHGMGPFSFYDEEATCPNTFVQTNVVETSTSNTIETLHAAKINGNNSNSTSQQFDVRPSQSATGCDANPTRHTVATKVKQTQKISNKRYEIDHGQYGGYSQDYVMHYNRWFKSYGLQDDGYFVPHQNADRNCLPRSCLVNNDCYHSVQVQLTHETISIFVIDFNNYLNIVWSISHDQKSRLSKVDADKVIECMRKPKASAM